jgi:probable phosphoglycerate mutase
MQRFDYRSAMPENGLPHWTLRCDGGSRGNPGPGASAYVLIDPRGVEVEARGQSIGTVTNNTAEYKSLIAGLEAAARHGVDQLLVCMDSELVVRQMRGEYRVKHPALKELHQISMRAAAKLGQVKFREVPREQNARADQLVNETLDKLETESPR